MLFMAMDHQATKQHRLKAANGCLSCDCPGAEFADAGLPQWSVITDAYGGCHPKDTSSCSCVSQGGRNHTARKNWRCWFMGERKQKSSCVGTTVVSCGSCTRDSEKVPHNENWAARVFPEKSGQQGDTPWGVPKVHCTAHTSSEIFSLATTPFTNTNVLWWIWRVSQKADMDSKSGSLLQMQLPWAGAARQAEFLCVGPCKSALRIFSARCS